MPQPQFTIIIPLYKTEQYLFECLNSVITQKFQNYECLIINDGSVGVELSDWNDKQLSGLDTNLLSQLRSNMQKLL
jgi:cellulose synthase/poly-beta-1,6-N-acetylglucosamine synthase-like glycosyltransferase